MDVVSLTLQALPFSLHHRPFPPPLLLLQKLGAVRLLHLLLPSFRRAWACGEVGGCLLRWLSWCLLSPISPFGRRRWGGTSVLASGGECDSAASSLSGVGVAGPSHSQESTVLARSAPLSVDSSALVERDPQLCSREAGGFSGGRSRSSRASLSRDQESREGRRHARSWSGGSRAWSRESRSRSTTRSWSCGRVPSHRGPSCSPSARVRSRQFRSQSSDCSWGRRVHSRSWSDRLWSRRERSRSSGRCRSRRGRSRSRSSWYRSRGRSRSRNRSLLSSDQSRLWERSW